LTQAVLVFASSQTDLEQRLWSFIQWAEPGGTAGINHIHKAGYRRDDPWFDWSLAYVGGGHSSARSAILRAASVGRTTGALSKPSSDGLPKILIPEALVEAGWFLSFAKAYINVLALYKSTRTHLKSTIQALSAFEDAFRSSRLADAVSFEDVGPGIFQRADQIVATFPYGPSRRYDIAKELEILSGLLQSGYHSKTLRLDGAGFSLVRRPFSFRSSIPQATDRRQLVLDDFIREKNSESRMTSETVAAVGQAYCLSRERYGPEHLVTAMASMSAIPLTTTSMRMSDFLNLRADALFYDEDTGRHKINVYRPKINRYQSVPVPKKLAGLADELFRNVVAHTALARRAFSFYIEKFGDDFSNIDELYIPDEIRPIFEQPYFRRDDLEFGAMEGEAVSDPASGQAYFGLTTRLKRYRGVEKPNDILENFGTNRSCCLPVPYVQSFLKFIGVTVPKRLRLAKADMFVTEGWLLSRHKWIPVRAQLSIHCLFASEGRSAVVFGSTDELRRLLLDSFKKQSFPHWPYTAYERKTRLDEALVATFSPMGDFKQPRDVRGLAWWRPSLLNSAHLLSWINYTKGEPPYLFHVLGIRCSDGRYPSFTLHDTRKHFQTTALLAGVNETFLDELSGRTSGKQSAHYDLRTPKEIALRSIELFDPEVDSNVAGPVARASRQIPVVDRKAFLYQNSAPKQLTEVGGCTTSWSVNPCDKHGSCMTCDRSVWRKGDETRLPRIIYLKGHSERMISEGRRLLNAGGPPQPIERHIRQNADVLERCEAILSVEADRKIATGTIVTFAAAR